MLLFIFKISFISFIKHLFRSEQKPNLEQTDFDKSGFIISILINRPEDFEEKQKLCNRYHDFTCTLNRKLIPISS